MVKNIMIISGFAGIGKTTLASKEEGVVDLESGNFK
jgi:adenylate kinase